METILDELERRHLQDPNNKQVCTAYTAWLERNGISCWICSSCNKFVLKGKYKTCKKCRHRKSHSRNREKSRIAYYRYIGTRDFLSKHRLRYELNISDDFYNTCWEELYAKRRHLVKFEELLGRELVKCTKCFRKVLGLESGQISFPQAMKGTFKTCDVCRLRDYRSRKFG